jgi:hypothetical protein
MMIRNYETFQQSDVDEAIHPVATKSFGLQRF